jgi:hypothetical protein
MKVLHQIIEYLRGRGLLTKEQLVELASQGILRWENVYEDRGSGEDSDEPRLDEPGEETDEPPPRARPGGGRGGRRTVATLELRELCTRLAESFDAWRGPLEGLTRLGRRGGCSSWEEAAVAVRNVAPERLPEVLADALQEQAPGLGALWGALEWEEYFGVRVGLEERGPTDRAFRALLRAADPAALQPYAALLKGPEVAAVCNLVQAQRRLLGALGELLRRRPELVASSLRREGPAPAYWSFVLVHAARRGVPGRRPWPADDEHPPPRSPPEEADWPRRWARAVGMDGAAVTPFLVERTGGQRERPRLLAEKIAGVIAALGQGPRNVLNRYYRARQSTSHIAGQTGQGEADVRRILEGFHQDLRQALSEHPLTRVFLQPAAARGWDAFLGDCVALTLGMATAAVDAQTEQEYADLLQTHFGPAFDLLCPVSWD